MHKTERADGGWIFVGRFCSRKCRGTYDMYEHALNGVLKRIWASGPKAGFVEIGRREGA